MGEREPFSVGSVFSSKGEQKDFPIPVRDRTEEWIKCEEASWLWEAFRVLQVGGKLHCSKGFRDVPSNFGFCRDAGENGLSVWKKPATWPMVS